MLARQHRGPDYLDLAAGARRLLVPLAWGIYQKAPEEMAADAVAAVAAGFAVIKRKVGCRLEDDLAAVRAVSRALDDQAPPWRYWQAMVTAMEYGVAHKIQLASDLPSGTIENVSAGLRNVNAPVEGIKLPTIPVEIQDRFIYENWKAFSPEWV